MVFPGADREAGEAGYRNVSACCRRRHGTGKGPEVRILSDNPDTVAGIAQSVTLRPTSAGTGM